MKIGILQCDDVKQEFLRRFDNYHEMIIAMISGIEPAWDFHTYQCHRSQLPRSPSECDAYITTGSRHSVNDNFAWIRQLEVFIRRLDEAEIKFVGICFGHQLMAKALGGSVQQSEKGWGIGAAACHVYCAMEWMSPYKHSPNLLISHQDQVVSLPKATSVLAGNDFCPNYMLLRGGHMLSMQGHPEFSAEYASALMDSRKSLIPANLVERAKESLNAEIHGLTVAQWVSNFIKMPAI